MRLTTQSSNQLQSIFGAAMSWSRTADATRSYLPNSDVNEVIGSLTTSMLGEVMKSLRSALSLR